MNNAVNSCGHPRIVGPGWWHHPEPFDITHSAGVSATDLSPILIRLSGSRVKVRPYPYDYQVQPMSEIRSQGLDHVWISQELRVRIRVEHLTLIAAAACAVESAQRARSAAQSLLKRWHVPDTIQCAIRAFLRWWQWGCTARCDIVQDSLIKTCAIAICVPAVPPRINLLFSAGQMPLFISRGSANLSVLQMHPGGSAREKHEYYAWLAMRDWVLSAQWTGTQSAECYDTFGYLRRLLVHRVGPSCIAATVINSRACPAEVVHRYMAAEQQPVAVLRARTHRCEASKYNCVQLDRAYFNAAQCIAQRKSRLWADNKPLVAPVTVPVAAAYWAGHRTPLETRARASASEHERFGGWPPEPRRVARHAEILLPAPSSYNIAVRMRVQGEGFQCAPRA